VEHVQDAAGLAVEHLRQGMRIDARQRDIAAEAIDQQGENGEPYPLLELGRLRKGAEVQVGGELLGGGGHRISLDRRRELTLKDKSPRLIEPPLYWRNFRPIGSKTQPA